MAKKMIRLLRSVLLTLLIGGCTTLGPNHLQATRNDYNIAIQRTSDEQLLLNLVRLKYHDTPLFLEVSSVSSQFTFQTGLSASGRFVEGSDTYGLNGSATFAERPTVTFTPLQGEKFVQRVLAPIELDTILLLTHSGWRIDRVLRLCVQRLNGLKNAPSASGPTPLREPVYKEFIRAAELLRALQIQDDLHMGYEIGKNKKHPMLRILSNGIDKALLTELSELLRIEPGLEQYRITADVTAADSETLAVGTRSLLGVMFYMSQAVEVPQAHKEAGKVILTKTAAGEIFDWTQVTGGMLHIHSDTQPPKAAAIAVPYREHWFYLDDSDLESKSTFSLLAQLFALQSGKTKSTTPVLTLPVGG